MFVEDLAGVTDGCPADQADELVLEFELSLAAYARAFAQFR